MRRLAAHYAPKPLTAARRVALDEAGLWARLQRQPHLTRLTPALAPVAVAVLLTCLSWSGLFMPPAHEGGPSVNISAMSSTEPWEYELLYSRELTDTAEDDDGRYCRTTISASPGSSWISDALRPVHQA